MKRLHRPMLSLLVIVAATGLAVFPDAKDASATRMRLDEAQRLYENRAYEQARQAATGFLEKVEQEEGSHSEAAADVLELLVRARLETGPYEDPELLSLAERLVAIRETQTGPKPLEVTRAVSLLADVFAAARRHKDAVPLRRRVVAEYQASAEQRPAELSTAMCRLAISLGRTGAGDEARELLENARATQEEVFGPDSLEVAEVLETFYLTLFAAFPDATIYVERALANRDAAGPQVDPARAWTMGILGLLRHEEGRYLEARRLSREALSVLETTLGRDHYKVSVILINLANTLQVMGYLAQTRPLYDRALEIREHYFGPDHVMLSAIWNNLGVIQLRTGDHERARRAFERTLEIRRNYYGASHKRVAEALNNLGLALLNLRDFEGSKRAYAEAIEIRQGLPGEATGLAKSHANLGRLYSEQGEYEMALSHLGQALELQKETFGPVHRDVAITLVDTGDVFLRMEDYGRAVDSLGRGVAMLRRTVGSEATAVPWASAKLAVAYYRHGLSGIALETAIETEETIRRQFRETTSVMSEREALRYASARASGLGVALTVLATSGEGQPGIEARVFDEVVRSRALVLDELATRTPATLHDSTPEVERLFQELRGIRKQLAHQAMEGYSTAPPGDHEARLAELQAAVESAERSLAEHSKSFRDRLRRFSVGLEQIVDALPESTTLVAYVHYPRLAMPGAAESSGLERLAPKEATPSYIAFILNSGQRSPTAVPIGPASTIDELVRGWRAEAASAPTLPSAAREAEARYRESGLELRRAIWDPVAARIGDSSMVLVVPDGSLHHVTLGALPTDEEGYLTEKRPVLHYLSAERDIVTLVERGPSGRGLLALGGPEFDGPTESVTDRGPHLRSACPELVARRFPALVGAGAEAADIAALWKEQVSDGEADVRLLTGARASEAAVEQYAPGRRVVHLATHSFFASSECGSVLESVSKTPKTEPEQLGALESPLLHTGLVLAGANRRAGIQAEADLEDGMLTAQEIASIDLSAAEWVILSACETGGGQVQTGEGVLGLRRAFQLAGSRTLVMSQWAIGDASTREWMRELYARRFAGLSTVDAVARANRAVLERRRKDGESTHPSFWGAFVAVGDWR